VEIINLAGEWDLVRLADSSVRRMQVPGDIYSALIHTGELPDPYFGENELKVQWPGREDWKLERRFWVPDHFLRLETIKLLAEVIDTVADVYLNGVLIGTSENMFRRFEADAGAFLHSGENTITIFIHSPEEAAIRAAQKLPYPIPASIYPVSSPHRNLIRKAQYMSGWDWGPCLMTGGIYDGIALIATDWSFYPCCADLHKAARKLRRCHGPWPRLLGGDLRGGRCTGAHGSTAFLLSRRRAH